MKLAPEKSGAFSSPLTLKLSTIVNLKEIPPTHRYAGIRTLTELFEHHSIGSKGERNKLLTKAHIEFGYNLKQIADVLGIHYSTVSKVIKNTNNCLFKT